MREMLCYFLTSCIFLYFMASNGLFFCLENSKARSNDFAEKNGLKKYEYVLHPRTTGFTFVVDRLREGKHLSQSVLFYVSGKNC